MIICGKCGKIVTEATFIQIRKADRTQKGVCYPCHARLTEYRAKRAMRKQAKEEAK